MVCEANLIFQLSRIDVFISLTIALTKFTIGFVGNMVVPIFPTLIDTHFNKQNTTNNNNSNFNYHQLSILFATCGLTQTFASLLLGYLCEILQSINIILFGTISQGIAILFYGIGNQYYFLILGRIFEGFSDAAIHIATASFIGYRYTDHRTQALIFGIGAVSFSLGTSLGPVYGGFLFQYYGKLITFLSFISMSFLQLIFVIVLIFYLRSNKIEKAHNAESHQEITTEISVTNVPNTTEINDITMTVDSEERIETPIHKPLLKPILLRFLMDPYIILSASSIMVTLINLPICTSTLSIYMRERFGSSESQQGLVWLLTIIGFISGFFIGNFLNTRFSQHRHIVLLVNIYIFSVGCIGLAVMPNWWSIAFPLCLILHQEFVLQIVLFPISNTIVEKRLDSQFGILSGIISTVISINLTLGSYLGPIVYSKIGFFYLNLIIFLIIVAYGPLMWFYKPFTQ